ncbi:hypothetical protein [Sporomusa sphaeroides]|uniref:Competence protein A n=1 Tax=Sporomusa sphaeroides DSM 2875 TaxID=1337886 RepID=A0A1U7MA33_9FIRM|nr:hypothetical protein [Sporomusa sphaeroides]OLS54296.1 hypothetical protein SPSPH_45420 [Sporomusa sphaeroides DSM 2875]CVK21676.1 hypothetical protein SSPH_04371 [Sporomusa sphaeroides DSM 2875]
MDIAITLKHDCTQVVIGKESKGRLEVKKIVNFEPVVQYLLSDKITPIQNLFEKIASQVKENYIHITIPTDLTIMNCKYFENVPNNNYLKQEIDRMVMNSLGLKDSKAFIIDKGKIVKTHKNVWLTGVAVKKKYIELLSNAAAGADLKILSIENEAISAFRFEGFNDTYCYIENNVAQTTFTLSGSHPKIGIFTIIKRYLDEENQQKGLSEAVEQFDQIAADTFGQVNYNACNILQLQGFHKTFMQTIDESELVDRFKIMPMSDYVISQSYGPADLTANAAPIGLLLSTIYERRSKREALRSSKSVRK